MFDVKNVSGIGDYKVKDFLDGDKKVGGIYSVLDGKAFLVLRTAGDGEIKTVEVRTDGNLAKKLCEEYESVMESRYFGRGGIEIVMAGQLTIDEIYDLVRLSYNLSLE